MLQDIKINREKALKGELTFMPYGLDRFSKIIPGQIQSLPTICTGSTSSGKSSLARYLYCIKAVELAIDKDLPYKLILFNLEDSNSQVEDVIRCHIYYKKYGEIIDIILLNSMKVDSNGNIKLLTDKQLHRLEEIESIVQRYLSYITMYDNCYTSIEIYQKILIEATNYGKFYYNNTQLIPINVINGDIWDTYKLTKPLLCSVVVDNTNKLVPTKDEKDLYNAIIQMNTYACIYIVKGLKFHYCGLQQQNAVSTSIEHIKADYFYPKETNLGDCNFPGRDARQMFGICQPYKFNQKKIGKYDLIRLKGYFRVINVIKNTYGRTGDLIPTLFIAQCCEFITLPEDPTEEELEKIYKIVDDIKEYENN